MDDEAYYGYTEISYKEIEEGNEWKKLMISSHKRFHYDNYSQSLIMLYCYCFITFPFLFRDRVS